MNSLVLVPFWRWPDGRISNPDASLLVEQPAQVSRAWAEALDGPIPADMEWCLAAVVSEEEARELLRRGKSRTIFACALDVSAEPIPIAISSARQIRRGEELTDWSDQLGQEPDIALVWLVVVAEKEARRLLRERGG